MTLFRKKYRVESARHPSWNYHGRAYYFVTICTRNRACTLGQVRNGVVGLSLQGGIAYQLWQEIPKHYESVRLDDFVVMPNHIHGLLTFVDEDKAILGDVIGSYKASVTRRCSEIGLPLSWQPRFHDKMPWGSGLPALRKYIRENPVNWEKDEFYRRP